jgi:hypothetical protein
VKHLPAVAALLAVIALGACSSSASLATFNAPPTYEGPGCYDHRNRLERTVKTRAECEVLTWTWKS